jgi:NAD dependent epimerase/dehydratase family enzyme
MSERRTALLLDILVNTKHKVEKVLVASSIGVYGEGAYTCATHGAEQLLLEQFFSASRLRDRTALQRVLQLSPEAEDLVVYGPGRYVCRDG